MIPDTKYYIGDASLVITYADINSVQAEVLVSSDDSYLSMGGGVSRSIRHAAGPGVVLDARKHVPCGLGDVVVTSAGKLPAKYVFHGVTIDLRNGVHADEKTIRDITKRSLMLAGALGIERMAFPAL